VQTPLRWLDRVLVRASNAIDLPSNEAKLHNAEAAVG
jgi:hypothetical protein